MSKQIQQIKKRAYIYTRVSTQNQAIDGQSLDTQRNKCMEWLSRNPDYELKNIFIEFGITGKKENRKALNEMRKTVRKGDAIILYSLNRLARKLSVWTAFSEEMKKKEIRIISITENIDTANKQSSELVCNLLAVVAQYEVEQICERTKHNLDEKRKRGELCNGKAPFGYNLYKGLNGIIYSYPFLEEQRIIDTIINHRDAGISWPKIAKYLQNNGHKTKQDALLWSISVICKIYKREKENREKYPILLDEEKILKYEKHKVPHVIPEDRIEKFLIDGKEFSHEDYNNFYNPGANYVYGNYMPSATQFKADIINGNYKTDDKTKLLVRNDFDKERCKEIEDDIISKVLENEKTKELYIKSSMHMKGLEMKRNFAADLIKSFNI